MDIALQDSDRYKLGEQARTLFEYYLSHQAECGLKTNPNIIWRDDENEGTPTWYTIESIAALKKIQEISKDMDLIRDALRRSDKLEVDPGGEYVRSLTMVVPSVKSYRIVSVAGFPPDITRDDLETFFLSFGKVERITLPLPGRAKHGTFALAQFEDAKDAARCVQSASRLYKGLHLTMALRQLKDNKVQVPPKVKQDPLRTLYVAGFPRDTPDEDVQQYFNQYGRVCSINVIRPRGLKDKPLAAFVEFTTVAELAHVVSQPHSYNENGLLIHTRNTSVTTFNKPQPRSDSVQHPLTDNRRNRILHFTGVDPVTTTKDNLHNTFAKYAKISRVHYQSHDTSGYIHLEEPIATEVAAKLQETGLCIGVEMITVRSLQGEEESMYNQCIQNTQSDSFNQSERPNQQQPGNKKRGWSLANEKGDRMEITSGEKVKYRVSEFEVETNFSKQRRRKEKAKLVKETKSNKKKRKKDKANLERTEKRILEKLGGLTVCPKDEKK